MALKTLKKVYSHLGAYNIRSIHYDKLDTQKCIIKKIKTLI